MTKSKKILFIGKRLDAIKAALEANNDVYVLNFEKTKGQLTKKIKTKKYFEIIYNGNFKSIEHIEFDAIIPVTEKAVGLAYEFYKSRGQIEEKYLLCHNKLKMKEHAREHGITVTDFIQVSNYDEIISAAKSFGFPLVLKEIDSSGSRGQIIFRSESDIPKDFSNKEMLAEKWVYGKELSVESFVLNNEIIFTNITKYQTHLHCNILPSNCDEQLKNQILDFNKNVIDKFKITGGMTHAEYFQTENGLVLGEIAVRPPGGYIMKLIELAYGFSAWRALIDIKIGVRPFLYTKAQFFSSVWIIHPGEGNVEKEPDFISILNNPLVTDIKCNLKKGTKVLKREGSGQDYGHILMKSKNIDDIYMLIEKIKMILN